MHHKKEHIKNLARKIYPLILGIGLPATLRSTSQYFQQLIDTMYIGQYNSDSLAAISSVSIVLWLGDGFWVGLGGSTTVMIAQRLGAKKLRDAASVARASFIIGAYLSLFYLIAWQILPPYVVQWMNLTKNSAIEAEIYIRNYAWVYIARIVCYIVPSSILEAQGRTRMLMIATLVQSAVNIILDPIFIWGLGLGIQGAALATVLAELAGAIIISFYFWHSNTLHLRTHTKIPNAWYVKERLILGLPQTFMNFSWSFVSSYSLAMMNKIIPMGSAIFNIGYLLRDFTFRILLGFDSAVVSLVGRSFGAKRMDRLKAVLRSAFIVKTWVGFGLAAVLTIFQVQIVNLFTSDSHIAENILKSMPWVIGCTVQVIYSGVFMSSLYAMGESRWNLAIGFITDASRFAVQYLSVMVLQWGVAGGYVALIVQETIRYILVIFFLRYFLKHYDALWKTNKNLPQEDAMLHNPMEDHPLC